VIIKVLVWAVIAVYAVVTPVALILAAAVLFRLTFFP
jgi:hypothetical protein